MTQESKIGEHDLNRGGHPEHLELVEGSKEVPRRASALYLGHLR
jgi:hypothetical protein